MIYLFRCKGRVDIYPAPEYEIVFIYNGLQYCLVLLYFKCQAAEQERKQFCC